MKVLLAVDGSEHGRKAVEKCCELLRLDPGSEIKILSVADDSQPMGADHLGVASELYASLRDQMKEVADRVVAEAFDDLSKCVPGDTQVTKEVVIGSPKTKIVEVAEEWEASVIVLGSHGYGFLERVLLGSVSQSVLHNAHCAVLVVRT